MENLDKTLTSTFEPNSGNWFDLARFCKESRHGICQKNYTAGISGQKLYTLIFTEFQQFW